MADLQDFGQDQLDQALENFDEIQFDCFSFCSVMMDASLPFMVSQLFQNYDLLSKFHIPTEVLYNFSKDISQGYFKENPYHNQ